MTDTPGLIDMLVARATPVRRAWPPASRAGGWLLLAGAVVAVLAWLHGVRPDLAARLARPEFCGGVAASLLTGALAAVAAFTISLPDRSRLWLLLPLPTWIMWISTVSYGCLHHWVAFDPAAVDAGELLRCVATLLLSGVPLSVALFLMLRPAARLRPTAAIMAGAVAVAALTASALSLLHAFDASLMVLLWNFGAAGLVIAIDATVGPQLLDRRLLKLRLLRLV
jgi:hypothetical protein